MYNVGVQSNAIQGEIIVTFMERNDVVAPVVVLVIYTVTINDVEYGPFQQFTNDDSNIVWRKHQLTEEEMADGNGVKIQVRIFEFHC